MPGQVSHNKKHPLNSTIDHEGLAGATQHNLLIVDASGLPQDSGESIRSLENIFISRDMAWAKFVAEDMRNDPPVSPVVGAIYLVGNTPSGAFVGHALGEATWDGIAWSFNTVEEGVAYFVKNVGGSTWNRPLIKFNDGTLTNWNTWGVLIDHNDLARRKWSEAGHTIDTVVNFGTNKATNIGNATVDTDAVAWGQLASNALRGLVSTVAQSFAGAKTFVDGLVSNKRLDVIGSTQLGSVGEEYNALVNLQDPAAGYDLISVKGANPTTKDYVEAWGGEDATGQWGAGFILKHDKTNKKWKIGYSTSGRNIADGQPGATTWLFEVDSTGTLKMNNHDISEISSISASPLSDLIIKLGDTVSANRLDIQNESSSSVYSIDSLGNTYPKVYTTAARCPDQPSLAEVADLPGYTVGIATNRDGDYTWLLWKYQIGATWYLRSIPFPTQSPLFESQDMLEHFTHNLGITAFGGDIRDSVDNILYNDNILLLNCLSRVNPPTFSKNDGTSIAMEVSANDVGGIASRKTFTMSTFDRLLLTTRLEVSTNDAGAAEFLIYLYPDIGSEDIILYNESGGTWAITSTGPGGNTTIDSIVMDLTSMSEITIDIFGGVLKLYHNGTLKATISNASHIPTTEYLTCLIMLEDVIGATPYVIMDYITIQCRKGY